MTNVTDIDGVGPSTEEDLAEAGYESVEDIAQADPNDLSDISGITHDRALEFMVSAGNMLDEDESSESESESESGDEFDLTPEEISDELEEEVEEVEEELEGDLQDEGDEPESESESGPYEVTVSFETPDHFHVFHAAVMRYHEKVYTSNQPEANAMQKILDDLTNSDDSVYELTRDEINTLHTAIKQTRTEYQGNNKIDHMDALAEMENQINDQRRALLF